MKVLLGRDEIPRFHRLSVRWVWEPRDIWFGVFWNRVRAGGPEDCFLLVYLCLVPCLPVCIAWRTT